MPGIGMHIVQRGHNRRDCFLAETDYLVYLANLRDLARETACAVHAFCLMTNHVHLFLTPSDAQGCARLMRNLGQRYAQYFNRRYGRSGSLWGGRFRSSLVDSPRYAIALHRYVERNPVRAHMVSSPSAYRWSSYAGNSGNALNQLLTPHPEYLALGMEEKSRHAAYRHLLSQDDDPGFLRAIRDATNGGFALLGEELKSKVPTQAQQRLERRPPGPQPGVAPRTHEVPANLELELGLRPRRS